ncbi:SMC-Scp complex subunit ScpB [Aquibacillus sp. 3ASR75-11]|uniref:Segregation and condensation protein B n=1 Tax=Terrihalobacillus insolitus TaxID=2950438 RepID=A0A9X4ALX6_9BACI|nr:SMC-Scp complex subunit ScpB [Terrihalobacillus insolitus]MDC3413095.1 SMC-Scp complex subunit ScpB [Terrihalobacillus insolitus]MDC3424837.1 SMC-Scp complex subunit ScpB [Terrihalobacillus insolitus]
MEIEECKAITEGLLFASGDEGLSKKQIQQILEVDDETVEHIMDELKYDYEHLKRGITIMQSQNLFHLTTKPEHSIYYDKLIESPQTSRLSQAALETLAIVAYQQPITKTEIEEIRGVKSDRPIHTLVNRSLIEEIGRKEGVGRPILYGTSVDFLTYFGLTSIDELPPLPDGISESDVEDEADLFFEQFQNQFKQNEK